MKLNLDKTNICYLHRKSRSLLLPGVADFKCLGIIIDQNLSFVRHVEFLKDWTNRRKTLVMLLKKLNIKEFVLVRLLEIVRNRILYGLYWICLISDSQFKKLTVNFGGLLQIIYGFNKLVPSKTIHLVTGTTNLAEYVKYRLCLRSFTEHFKMKRSLLHSINNHFNKEDLGKQYKFRNSVITLSKKWSSKCTLFPCNLVNVFNAVKSIFDKLVKFENLSDVKKHLREEFLVRKLDKSISLRFVDDLNRKYYSIFVS